MVLPKLNIRKKRKPPQLVNDPDDEEQTDVPKLPADPPKALVPYPTKQLIVLACCRFSEPVAMTSSFPYLFFMIRDFHLTDNEKEIGRYAGFLASCFSFAQFFSGLPWGRLSDSWGRKPVILCGLLGTCAAMLIFGFSKSFTQALIARTAAGLLNGNVGVIRTMVAEMVTEKTHQARAFSVMPFVWSAGSILGPVVGGALADPARQYPDLFGNSTFFKRYPYALPNLFASSFLFISCIFGFLFTKETLDSKKDQEDLGIRFRRFVHRIFLACIHLCTRTRMKISKKISKPRLRSASRASEISEYSDDEQGNSPRSQRRRDSEEALLLSPTKSTSRRPSAYYRYRRRSSSFSALMRPRIPDQPPAPKFSDILTKQVMLNMVVYAGLALHTISMDQLFPLLCSTKVQDGGLGMTPKQIGAALSVSGVMAMVLQVTIFPWGHNKFGGLRCLRVVLGMYAILYFVFSIYGISNEQCIPYLHNLLRSPDTFDNSPLIWSGIIGVLAIKVLAGVFAFPSCAILITQSSPSRELLGTVNGTNQALGSLCRAIGPTIAGSMYSRSLEAGKPWIVWRYGLGLFSVLVWIGGWFLSDENHLPAARDYAPVDSVDIEDIVEETIEEEHEDGETMRRARSSDGRISKVNRHGVSGEASGVKLDEESSDDEYLEGVSAHLLSREH